MDQLQYREVSEQPQDVSVSMAAALQWTKDTENQLRQQGHSHEADNMNIIHDGLLLQFVNTLRRIQGAAEVPQQARQSRSVHGMKPLPGIPEGHATMAEQSREPNAEGPSEQGEDDQDHEASRHLPIAMSTPAQMPVARSWAHVASARPPAPERSVSRANRDDRNTNESSVETRTTNRQDIATGGVAVETSSRRAAGRPNDRNVYGILEDGKAGVVKVEGPINTMKHALSFISARIHEGPIYDISMTKEREVVIIFQYALHAQIFVDRNTESVATRGESVFGPGEWTVTLGNPMEWTDTLRRMDHPHRERRRITFAKSRLFADNLSLMKWVREVQDVAGAANVDFVWAFNTGNATAVFFNVATSRKVFQTFTHWRASRGCYEGLTLTYSTDPCEKELQLSTQLRYHVQPAHRRFQKMLTNDNGGRNQRHHHRGRK